MGDLTYQSSEEFQRHSRDVFASKDGDKAKKVDRTEKDKLKAILDQYIVKHSKTSLVREMAKHNSRTADYQLDLSADLVEILEKIKSDLR